MTAKKTASRAMMAVKENPRTSSRRTIQTATNDPMVEVAMKR